MKTLRNRRSTITAITAMIEPRKSRSVTRRTERGRAPAAAGGGVATGGTAVAIGAPNCGIVAAVVEVIAQAGPVRRAAWHALDHAWELEDRAAT